MTREQKIEYLSVLTGEPIPATGEGILGIYLDLAGDKILNRMYPYKDNYEGLEVPDRYVSIQLKAACYAINKIGAEGQIQHIENGIHRNYGDADIPESMLKDITPYAQAIR